jgi:class 3 adenylate cyclase
MQETLLGELTTTRRIRLHGRVAEALERRWGDRAEEYASRLAHHFVESATLSPRLAEKAVRYSVLSGKQAEAQTAWDEAARWYEAALTLITGADHDLGEDEAGLLLAYGRCCSIAARHRDAWRALMRARALYVERDDPRGIGEATVQALSVLGRTERLMALVEEGRALVRGRDPYFEALLATYHAAFLSLAGKQDEGRALVVEAASLPAVQDYPDVQALLVTARAWAEPGVSSTAARLFGESFERQASLGQVQVAALFGGFSLNSWLFLGDFQRAEQFGREALDYVRRNHIVAAEGLVVGGVASMAMARGDFDFADQIIAETTDAWPISFRCAQLRGRLEEKMGQLPEVSVAGGNDNLEVLVRAPRVYFLRAVGRREEASADLRALPNLLPGTHPLFRLGSRTMLAGALDSASDGNLVQEFYQALLDAPEAHGTMWSWSVDHARGSLALQLGLDEAASRHFGDGLAWAEREGCHIIAGECLLGLADVATRAGRKADALSLLDRAAAIFQRHGARGYLDKAVALKLQLQGIGPSTDLRTSIDRVFSSVQSEQPDLSLHASGGMVTLLFSDIENSTALNEEMGDTKWMKVLRAHNAIIDEQVKHHAGHVVKTMGDGYMVAFASPEQGLTCAIAIQRQLAIAPGLQGIRIRIGLHTGEMVKHGDDFFGRHVNLAARVGSAAVGGQVLVSAALHDLLAPSGAFAFDPGRDLALKGLTGTHRIHALLV